MSAAVQTLYGIKAKRRPCPQLCHHLWFVIRKNGSQLMVSGMSHWDMLETLYVSSGFGTPLCPQRWAGRRSRRGRSGHLCLDSCSDPSPDKCQREDGWMEGWMEAVLHQLCSDFCPSSTNTSGVLCQSLVCWGVAGGSSLYRFCFCSLAVLVTD